MDLPSPRRSTPRVYRTASARRIRGRDSPSCRIPRSNKGVASVDEAISEGPGRNDDWDARLTATPVRITICSPIRGATPDPPGRSAAQRLLVLYLELRIRPSVMSTVPAPHVQARGDELGDHEVAEVLTLTYLGVAAVGSAQSSVDSLPVRTRSSMEGSTACPPHTRWSFVAT
jgi:hypothetical protein